MPPRKSTSGARRPLSIETGGQSSDLDLDSDGDTGFDPVQAATDLRRVIDGHKKRRFENRKAIEKQYAARVAEIVKRTELRLAEQDKALARTRRELLARLIAAVEARDAAQRAVADKVGRFYDSCVNLTTLLQSVYTGLAAQARSAALGEGYGRETEQMDREHRNSKAVAAGMEGLPPIREFDWDHEANGHNGCGESLLVRAESKA